jgi:hypothetical protein
LFTVDQWDAASMSCQEISGAGLANKPAGNKMWMRTRERGHEPASHFVGVSLVGPLTSSAQLI